jgi:hypothetical protein
MSSLSARRGSKSKSPVASPRTGIEGPAPTALRDIVLGEVHALDPTGQPLVDFPGNPRGAPIQALAAGTHDDSIVGRTVALAFLGGDRSMPLVLGVVCAGGAPATEIERDQGRRVIEAQHEIVLRCGKASITLTRAGKVLVRGAYVSLRSSGMQRIIGASVHIN